MELSRIGVDTSKHVFTVHGVDGAGRVVLRRDVRCGGFVAFMAKVICHLRPGARGASARLLNLVGRKPKTLAAVALANETARIVWAMITRGETYQPRGAAAA